MKIEFGFCYRESESFLGSGILCLWISFRGKRRLVPTGYEIRSQEWDSSRGVLLIPDDCSGRRRRLTKYARSMSRDLRIVEGIVIDLERSSRRFSVDDVAGAFLTTVSGMRMLGVYASIEIDELLLSGNHRSSRAYLTAVRRFVSFNGGLDIEMSVLTPGLMSSFQHTLLSEGISLNTISFYMRTLRAIYNKAVAEGIVPARLVSPFEDVYTDVPLPVKSRRGLS